jgi:hypothetical protein
MPGQLLTKGLWTVVDCQVLAMEAFLAYVMSHYEGSDAAAVENVAGFLGQPPGLPPWLLAATRVLSNIADLQEPWTRGTAAGNLLAVP